MSASSSSQPFGGPKGFTPGYLLLGADELRRRASLALETLRECRACPRDCGVNRLEDRWSACKTGRLAVVTSAFPHHGEEDCLRGWNGSGTIFFGHCNLRCVFCQNYDISQGLEAGPLRPGRGGALPSGTPGITPKALAGTMLRLQELGCHNINFVTPEHVVPQILEAIPLAAKGGLKLPLVYNTSAYDSLETLRWLEGIFDIFMPDLKLFSAELSRRYLKAEDYPSVARMALWEMNRQVGPLQIGSDGLARRGVLIRHLVMPGLPRETEAILDWIFEKLGPESQVNIMGQYRPGGRVDESRFPELNRPLDRSELLSAHAYASRCKPST